jgi:hypothetical protein
LAASAKKVSRRSVKNVMGSSKHTLVDISLGVVGGLVLLVDDSVLSSGGTAGEGCVGVLGDRLVGLLGCLSSGALDGLRDVVNSLLGGC